MQGLITKERKNLDPAAAPFAKDPAGFDGLREGASLIEVVNLTEILLFRVESLCIISILGLQLTSYDYENLIAMNQNFS